jgi:hypothetical protein
MDVLIGSQDDDDSRQILISLSGITGAIRRHIWDQYEAENEAEPASETVGQGVVGNPAARLPTQQLHLP